MGQLICFFNSRGLYGCQLEIANDLTLGPNTKRIDYSMYGVDGSVLMWLESYLSLMVQYVKFVQDVSSTSQLKTGVTQN